MFAEAIFTSALIQIFLLDCYNSLSINLSLPVPPPPQSFLHTTVKGNLIPAGCLMAISSWGNYLIFLCLHFLSLFPVSPFTYIIGSLNFFHVCASKVLKTVPGI